MHIGLVAYEFLPAMGGMQQVAANAAQQLADRHDVTVFARPTSISGPGTSGSGSYVHKPILTGDLAVDGPALEKQHVDAWLFVNAGTAPLASRLGAPVLQYAHGNDFLNPWIGRHRPWFGPLVKVPAGWRVVPHLKHAYWRADIRRGFDRVGAIVVVSQFTAKRLVDFHPAAEQRVLVIPPGVSDQFFQHHVAAPPDPVINILSVARLTEAARRKNIESVLRAVAALPPAIQVTYTIVGDGDDRPRLEALSQELGIADRVRFVGSVNSEALRRHYAKSDLFVLAARATANDVEGFGIVYLEASAAGVPSLLSRTGGATDAVQEGVNGLIVPDGTPEDIRAGIERFAASRDTFTRERVRGVAEPYRWRTIAGRLEEVLIRLVDASRTRLAS